MSETPAVSDAGRGPMRPDYSEMSPRKGKHADGLRDFAYQLWAFTHERNAEAVARTLLADFSEEWGTPPNLPALARRIRYWADVDAWSARVRADLASIAPDIEGQIVTELAFGALEGARTLRKVIRGEISGPDSRTRAIAAQIALDRFGFDPKTVNDRIMRATARDEDKISSASMLDLTPDELAERLSRLRDEPIEVEASDE